MTYMQINTTHGRIPVFGNRNGARFFQSNNPIDLRDLENIAPSVFAEGAHGSRSDKYVHIPTREVVGALVKEGFQPYSVMQGGSRDEAKRGFTKHLIRFRHETALQEANAVGKHVHEVCVLNSHDGTSSYRIFAGVFRMVCKNGMVVADGDVREVRVGHTGSDVPHKVVEGSFEVLNALPAVEDKIHRLEGTRLTTPEQHAFARAALVARYGESNPPVTPEQALGLRRHEDADQSLWSTLNVVQENIVRGGLRYNLRDENTGRIKQRRRTSAMNGIQDNVNVNRALWALADEMARLKAA